jgi:uncharacterized RDD family membrane protein YckC
MNRYRTIPRRIAAWLIDLLPLAPTLAVGLTFYRHSYGTPIGLTWTLALSLVVCAYSIYFHGRYGATPGKSLMKCRLVSAAKEEKIGFRTAALRESPWIALGILGAFEDHWAKAQMPDVAANLGYISMAWYLADLATAAFHPKRRGLHDLIAGTVVVREEPNQSPEPTSGLRPAVAHL